MKAHELLTEKKWTKVAVARDAAGAPTTYDHPDACKWCIHGVLKHVYAPDNPYGNTEDWANAYTKVREYVKDNYGIEGLIVFNDSPFRTYDDVHLVLVECDV